MNRDKASQLTQPRRCIWFTYRIGGRDTVVRETPVDLSPRDIARSFVLDRIAPPGTVFLEARRDERTLPYYASEQPLFVFDFQDGDVLVFGDSPTHEQHTPTVANRDAFMQQASDAWHEWSLLAVAITESTSPLESSQRLEALDRQLASELMAKFATLLLAD